MTDVSKEVKCILLIGNSKSADAKARRLRIWQPCTCDDMSDRHNRSSATIGDCQEEKRRKTRLLRRRKVFGTASLMLRRRNAGKSHQNADSWLSLSSISLVMNGRFTQPLRIESLLELARTSLIACQLVIDTTVTVASSKPHSNG